MSDEEEVERIIKDHLVLHIGEHIHQFTKL